MKTIPYKLLIRKGLMFGKDIAQIHNELCGHPGWRHDSFMRAYRKVRQENPNLSGSNESKPMAVMMNVPAEDKSVKVGWRNVYHKGCGGNIICMKMSHLIWEDGFNDNLPYPCIGCWHVYYRCNRCASKWDGGALEADVPCTLRKSWEIEP